MYRSNPPGMVWNRQAQQDRSGGVPKCVAFSICLDRISICKYYPMALWFERELVIMNH